MQVWKKKDINTTPFLKELLITDGKPILINSSQNSTFAKEPLFPAQSYQKGNVKQVISFTEMRKR